MYSQEDIVRLTSIKQKIEDIYKIVERHQSIVKSLEDFEGQPAILMLIVAISEQFVKLHKKNSAILENFDAMDIKGMIHVRNYIAHEYDGVNLAIIEDDLRENMPRIKKIIDSIIV
ncbi:MAG: DUF86 domain-containing protein [Campylobacterales bacterium]|nr:DUF86 domain-containing protein [Campylobacterales bacterium]